MKKLISIIMIVGIFFSISTVAYATEPGEGTFEIYGEVTDTQKFLNAEKALASTTMNLSSANQQNLVILAADYAVNLIIEIEGREVAFDGDLFTSIDTEDVTLAGVQGHGAKVILGDFTQTDKYNISDFEIRSRGGSEEAEILVAVEDIQTGEIIEMAATISSEEYTVIYDVAIENTRAYLEDVVVEERKSKLASKMVSLLKEENNYVNANNARLVGEAQPLALAADTYTYSTKNPNSGSYVSKGYLQTFFSGLKANGTFDCSNYSTLRTMLTQTGWKAYTSKTSKYFYTMYGVANGSTEYLVQISYGEMQHMGHENNNLNAEFEIKGSVLLSYDTVLKEADVLMYETGLKLTSGKFYLVIDSSSAAYFTSATRVYAFESDEDQLSLGSVLKSLYSGLDIAFSLFTRPELYTSDTTPFYNTSTGAADCIAGDNYIWGTGGKMGVSGLAVGTLTSSTYGYDFEFVCNHNL